MQFDYLHKAGQDFVTVNFIHAVKLRILSNLFPIFDKLGGKTDYIMNGVASNYFTYMFPSYVSAQVIQEIIHNTCFVCGGLMKDSIAMQGTPRYYHDFGNDAGKLGTTMDYGGQAKQVKVRKCTQCGHSHT